MPREAVEVGAELPGFELEVNRCPTLSVTQIRVREPDPEEILGFSLARPTEGSISQAGVLWFDGWVVGRNDRVAAIEVMADGALLGRAPVSMPSPALVEGFPGVQWARRAAFRGPIGPVRLPQRFQLEIAIQLRDQRRLPFATIEGERAPLPACGPDLLQPLMLTGLGRSGTTWVMQVLEQHPGIAVFRPFDYEPRVAAYWTEVLSALSEPASYMQCLTAAPTPHGDSVWWLGPRAMVPHPPQGADSRAENWLGVAQLNALAAVSTERIEAFYREAAKAEGKSGVRFFSEKFRPGERVQSVLWEIYPDAKEVFLVRDFRDMVTSMLAYSKKRGFGLFGRHASGSDEEFILGNVRNDVERLQADWRMRSGVSFLLRYEDLILEPEQELARLMTYIGADADAGLLTDILRTAAAQRQDKQSAHLTSVSVRDSIGRWRNELTEPLREACEEALTDALKEFGYLDDPA
jgi:hypothetical protein